MPGLSESTAFGRRVPKREFYGDPDAPAEDAKHMLISCSAFANYSMEKHIKSGGHIG